MLSLELGKGEGLVFGSCVETEKQGRFSGSSGNDHREGTQFLTVPVGGFFHDPIGSEPAHVGESGGWIRVSGEEGISSQRGMLSAQFEKSAHKLDRSGGFRGIVPGDPVEFVVLAIGVVVSLLGSSSLIASEEKGDTLRKNQGGQEISDLAGSQFPDVGIVGGTFDAVIPGQVVRVAISVAFPVRQVVFLVVTDEIVEGESIVRGDEVHTGCGSSPIVGEKLLTPGDPRSKVSHDIDVSFPEPPNIVPKLSIQLAPVVGKISDLVAVRTEVPGFGDQLGL